MPTEIGQAGSRCENDCGTWALRWASSSRRAVWTGSQRSIALTPSLRVEPCVARPSTSTRKVSDPALAGDAGPGTVPAPQRREGAQAPVLLAAHRMHRQGSGQLQARGGDSAHGPQGSGQATLHVAGSTPERGAALDPELERFGSRPPGQVAGGHDVRVPAERQCRDCGPLARGCAPAEDGHAAARALPLDLHAGEPLGPPLGVHVDVPLVDRQTHPPQPLAAPVLGLRLGRRAAHRGNGHELAQVLEDPVFVDRVQHLPLRCAQLALHARRLSSPHPEGHGACKTDRMTDRTHAMTPDGSLTIGYAAMLEQFHPREAVDLTAFAEEHGFSGCMAADHFQPWVPQQGQASFVWNVLSAVGERTRGDLGPGVTFPSFRFRPAIVAQAAATLEAMYPGRSWLGVGAGEALNEHVIGGYWPEAGERSARLFEALEVINKLFEASVAGKDVKHSGRFFTMETSRLWTMPATPPPVLVATAGPINAKKTGKHADGIITVGAPLEKIGGLFDKFA